MECSCHKCNQVATYTVRRVMARQLHNTRTQAMKPELIWIKHFGRGPDYTIGIYRRWHLGWHNSEIGWCLYIGPVAISHLKV